MKTPTSELFVKIYTEIYTRVLAEHGEESWAEKHGDSTPEQVAIGLVNDYSPEYEAFCLGLGAKEDPTPDAGPWCVKVNPENPRNVALYSDDFDADVAISATISGDFATAKLKYAYARRLARLMNAVSLANVVPPPVDDKVMGFVDVIDTSDNPKRPQVVRPYWMPDLAPGKYAIYAVPVEVAPPLSADQNLIQAASNVLAWTRGIFLDPTNPRTGRRRKYAMFDNVPTPDEFKLLAEAVQAAQGQPPDGGTQTP